MIRANGARLVGCLTLVIVSSLLVATAGAGATIGADVAQQETTQPIAAFEFSPTNPEPDETVTLNASTSHDPDGEIETYRWDFDGDGEIDAEGGPIQRIVFPSAGTYEVSLTVVDNDGATNTTAREVVVVGDEPPVVNLEASPSEVSPGETVTLDPTDSSDPDGQIVTWEFDTDGDGTFDESYDSPTTLRIGFEEPGTYEITLRVTDNDGLSATANVTVVVESTSPTPGDGSPTDNSPAEEGQTATPASGDRGMLGTLDGVLPGGVVLVGLLALLVGGGLVLYWRSEFVGGAANGIGGSLGNLVLALLLVMLFIGVPIGALRGRFGTPANVDAEVAVVILEFIGLALIALVGLLYVVYQYTSEREPTDTIGILSVGRFRGVVFSLGFLGTSLLTVGAGTVLFMLDLPVILTMVAGLVVSGVTVIPLGLAFVLITMGRSGSSSDTAL